MATCISDSSGILTIQTPQPIDINNCTMLILSPIEYQAISSPNIFIDYEDGASWFAMGLITTMIIYLSILPISYPAKKFLKHLLKP